MKDRAFALARYLEGKLTARWHIALTGSCLYGDNPKDIDFILYPNDEDDDPDETLPDLLKMMGITKFKSLDADYRREVYRARARDGTQVDFWIMRHR